MPDAAYNDALLETGDNLTWVRHLIRDTTTGSFAFTDNEINGWLAEVRINDARGAKRYFVAARILTLQLLTYLKKGAGVQQKKVAELMVKYGSDSASIETMIRTLANDYMRTARALSKAKPKRFRTIRHDVVEGVEGGFIEDRIT